ncbi:MAG: META domain-containing protein [Endomicrobia bacterium]|nr:META domain-containing protein [Endomicrobiia bacterium]MCL2506305.1 META domain-containing protein [Endomicrobiia bacterium]
MKVLSFVLTGAVCSMLFFSACATGSKVAQVSTDVQPVKSVQTVQAEQTIKNASIAQNIINFGAVKGKVWQLGKVLDQSDAIIFNASKLDPKKFSDIYTIQFNDSTASGKAAPNRYTAPFVLGEDDMLSFQTAASTMMMGIHTPDGLTETEFYKLLAQSERWSIEKDHFFIYTSDGHILVFNEFDGK